MRRNWKRGLCICMMSFMMVCSMAYTRAEGTIIIDGSFADWDGLELSYEDMSYPMRQGAAVISDEYLFVHLQGIDAWSTIGGTDVSIKDEAGVVHHMALQTNTNQFDLFMRDADQQNTIIEGASSSGALHNNARNWELAIPKAWCGDAASITIGSATIPVQKITKEEGETPIPPEETPTPPDQDDANTPPNTSGTGIVIDGYYDDWETLEHSDLDWNNNVYAKACAVIQNESICVHVRTTYFLKHRSLNLDNIVIGINGREYSDLQIKLRQLDSNGNVSLDGLSNPEPNKRYAMVAVIKREGKEYILGNAFYTTRQSQDREDFEFCMDTDKLAEALQVEIDTGTEIKISFPSIGEQSLIIEGTSSGPWILAGLGCGIVLCALVMQKKRRTG